MQLHGREVKPQMATGEGEAQLIAVATRVLKIKAKVEDVSVVARKYHPRRGDGNAEAAKSLRTESPSFE